MTLEWPQGVWGQPLFPPGPSCGHPSACPPCGGPRAQGWRTEPLSSRGLRLRGIKLGSDCGASLSCLGHPLGSLPSLCLSMSPCPVIVEACLSSPLQSARHRRLHLPSLASRGPPCAELSRLPGHWLHGLLTSVFREIRPATGGGRVRPNVAPPPPRSPT